MTSTPNVSMIASNDDARAAVGKVVKIRGTVQREKLGDITISTPQINHEGTASAGPRSKSASAS